MGNFHVLWQRGEPHKKALQEYQRTDSIQNLGKVLGYKMKEDEIKYNRAVSTSYHAQTVGKSTPDKPEGLFTRDIKNISVFITTLPQTQPLHNTSETLDTRSAP
jgi:hypothetical protein